MLPSLAPPLKLLLTLRATGLLRRIRNGLASPRRVLLTGTALVLALVWLGNAVASILFRDRFHPDTLRQGLLMSLFAYGMWPILKASWKRPSEAIEWSPAEKEFLVAGPFSEQELIAYRLCVILSATLFKALALSLLLLPDLGSWWLGFAGAVGVLTFLELTRLSAEILFWGMPRRPYLAVRGMSVLFVGGLAAGCLVAALKNLSLATVNAPAAFILTKEFFAEVRHLFASGAGTWATAPLVPFVNLMTATHFDAGIALNAVISLLSIAVLYLTIREVDHVARRWRSQQEQESAAAAASRWMPGPARSGNAPIPRVRQWAGVGPLAWRQLVGTRRYPSSLAVSMLIPALLSWAPLMVPLSPIESFLNVAGSVLFYSFLLLPSALKFDFRRDCDRLAVLKTLPIHPTAVVLGQLATPVGLTLLVQVFVVLVAYLVRPVPVPLLCGALALMLPINVVIYGMENLLFLLYPHRLNEEGVQIFLRSILLFSAKGILLGVALVAVFVWAVSCREVAVLPIVPQFITHHAIFVGGLWVIAVTAAVILTRLLARAYARFDPSLDLPS